jgi:hypothetical protein
MTSSGCKIARSASIKYKNIEFRIQNSALSDIQEEWVLDRRSVTIADIWGEIG